MSDPTEQAEQKDPYYGWYSAEAHCYGTSFWLNEAGEEVEVTSLSQDPNDSKVFWKDVQPRGKVVSFVREGFRGPEKRK